jgi:regulatory protein
VPTITALKEIPRKPKRRIVEFSDAEPVELSLEIIAVQGLLVGRTVTADTLRTACKDDARKMAETFALKLMNRKNCSEQGLRKALTGQGWSGQMADEIVDKCRTWGYLNDKRLAELVVNDAIGRKHLGPARIRQTLRSKGIDEGVGAAAQERAAAAEPPLVEQALAALKGKERGYARLDAETAKRRIIAFLQRRGFGFDTIRAVLARVGAAKEEEE